MSERLLSSRIPYLEQAAVVLCARVGPDRRPIVEKCGTTPEEQAGALEHDDAVSCDKPCPL